MNRIKTCNFPELSADFSELFRDDRVLIIVGVIGKSILPNCNKMSCFDLFSCHASFVDNEIERKEGKIKFFYEAGSKIIYVHFDTSFDVYIAADIIRHSDFEQFLPLNSEMRTNFAQMLLFATQICHIIVMVEPSSSFDASYLSLFKSLKIIREKYVLKFLPKLLKNTSAGSYLNKEVRLCSPRFLFFFEKLGRSINSNNLTAHEIEMEDSIYQMLRSNFIITNNAQLSLFSIPKNKKFLYVNTDEQFNSDPIADSLDNLLKYIEGSDEEFQYKPYRGYAIEYLKDEKTIDFDDEDRSFLKLLNEHVDEALTTGFDDSHVKFRGKGHFVRPPIKLWFETFKFMHKIFIENPKNTNFVAKDSDYKAFLDNFHTILDIDEQLFAEACNHGYEISILNYSELLPHHYSKSYHESKLEKALEVFHKYARGPDSQRLQEKLKDNCESIWINGKQQCEILSLRGNPCIMVAKHATTEGSSHSSGIVYVSACNCGKTQGRREDPYTTQKANYEFYQLMVKSCVSCDKAEVVDFPIFVPSISEFKAAEVFNKNLTGMILSEFSNKASNDEKTTELHLSASQRTQESESNLSLGSESSNSNDETAKTSSSRTLKDTRENINEIVVKVGEMDIREEKPQVSTTEYLPGMLLTSSPSGLLPLFPSWSLMRMASSSFYSHNTGLTENQMPGFLSGTNFLLIWEVKVRLEHAQTWAENYEKSRNRKKQKSNQLSSTGSYFTLKIFVGMEYECGRGHRFMMSSNETILRGGSKANSCGSKVIFNDMPLYFPCPCKNNSVAQLMRVHIVTPKAPVNINLDPKVKIRQDTEMIFSTGWNEPAKLSQSSYWVLRLPYIYHGEGDPIYSPIDVPSTTEALKYGCLLQGMFGITENETVE